MEPRLKIWVERSGEIVLSDWRVELLEQIDRTGSLSRAAEALDVPYRTAWEKLHALEVRWGFAFLATESGGPDGGRSRLTPQARNLITRFHQVAAGVQEQTEARFTLFFADDGT